MYTKYKDINFRSALEARTAVVLDKLKIVWKYEIQNFILESGQSYLPDFFIGKKLLIECKGLINKEELDFHSRVAKELKRDVLLISYDKSYFFDGTTEYDRVELLLIPENEFNYLSCSHCKTSSFVTCYGSFHCRECDKHEGDHDIINCFEHGIDDMYKQLEIVKYKPRAY